MSNTVIKVEGLSKKYQLGTIGYGSLQHDLSAWWAKRRGKDDPNEKIGEKNSKDLHGEFWALRDIGFEVQQGERLGIVGRNGAGKSTLLKLLSRVTSPTTGRMRINGRIASLLEVGTGFHPELTGRENVFLNGAILGMKRSEIQSKFDEIVDFSGVEKFIDTPVKRYSSGMYVRLAFSVAAHLESEILILDEVLAVGDSEFQKKCLLKLDSVSHGQGRTILFVSHNLPSLLQFCNSGLLLEKGRVVCAGHISEIVKNYRTDLVTAQGTHLQWANETPTNEMEKFARIQSYEIVTAVGEVVQTTLLPDVKYFISIDLTVTEYKPNLSLFVTFYHDGEVVFTADCYQNEGIDEEIKRLGTKRVLVEIPTNILMDKEYDAEVSLVLHREGWSLAPGVAQRLRFTNLTGAEHPLGYLHKNHPFTGNLDPSLVAIGLDWRVEQ